MRAMTMWVAAAGLAGLVAWSTREQRNPDLVLAQSKKPIVITRLFTGPDGLTHAEDIPVPLTGDALVTELSEMVKATGVEFHRVPPGRVNDWHTAPRRQLVITLSGKGEVEVAGGKKILSEPGHIELAEDLTGKGHITRVVGNEDRVTVQIPLTGPFPGVR